MIDKFPFRSRPGAAIQDAKYIALRYILKAWEDAVHDGLETYNAHVDLPGS